MGLAGGRHLLLPSYAVFTHREGLGEDSRKPLPSPAAGPGWGGHGSSAAAVSGWMVRRGQQAGRGICQDSESGVQQSYPDTRMEATPGRSAAFRAQRQSGRWDWVRREKHAPRGPTPAPPRPGRCAPLPCLAPASKPTQKSKLAVGLRSHGASQSRPCMWLQSSPLSWSRGPSQPHLPDPHCVPHDPATHSHCHCSPQCGFNFFFNTIDTSKRRGAKVPSSHRHTVSTSRVARRLPILSLSNTH